MAAGMKPAWPVILQTSLIGTALGLFLVVLSLEIFRDTPRNFAILCCVVSLLLLACGLIAFFFRSVRARSAWRAPRAVANFLVLGLASGLMLAVPLAVLAWPQFAGPLALAAFAVAGAAWLSRIAALARSARLRGKFAAAARWSALVLLFPAPGWLLGWGGGSLAAFAAAFALHFAGVLAERWVILAGAEPPRDLHDRAAS